MSTHFDVSKDIYSNLLNSKNVPHQFAAAIANCRSKILLWLLRPNFEGCMGVLWESLNMVTTLCPKNPLVQGSKYL